MNVLVLVVLFFNALSVFATLPPSSPSAPPSSPSAPPSAPLSSTPPTTPPPFAETTPTNGNHGRKHTDAPTVSTPKGLTDGSQKDVNKHEQQFEGDIGQHGKKQFVFPNGTGIDHLDNCTQQDMDNFVQCRKLVLDEIHNATSQLRDQIQLSSNETLKYQLKQEFWCTEVTRHIRLLGACIQPCKAPQVCKTLPDPANNPHRRRMDGTFQLEGPHCFEAGYDASVTVCTSQMNMTQEYYLTLNTEPNLETIMANFSCPIQPGCDYLVQQGLNVALLSYEANLLSSGHSIMISSVVSIFFVSLVFALVF